ncbi:hypothetical protein [Clostridium psychrophilum]|uniref:hypothetical protein n=1 Tax=Clostridium psychrophilum TaxID=132926 RepID=UPI001C0CB80A|nr:hypothetical protein [Clostridium psychrophilum]MBU3181225.1 hypothetical protein [Clostridium psychrophilum]
MNTISSAQNSISAYAQNEKVLRALETAKIEVIQAKIQQIEAQIQQQSDSKVGQTSNNQIAASNQVESTKNINSSSTVKRSTNDNIIDVYA